MMYAYATNPQAIPPAGQLPSPSPSAAPVAQRPVPSTSAERDQAPPPQSMSDVKTENMPKEIATNAADVEGGDTEQQVSADSLSKAAETVADEVQEMALTENTDINEAEAAETDGAEANPSSPPKRKVGRPRGRGRGRGRGRK